LCPAGKRSQQRLSAKRYLQIADQHNFFKRDRSAQRQDSRSAAGGGRRPDAEHLKNTGVGPETGYDLGAASNGRQDCNCGRSDARTSHPVSVTHGHQIGQCLQNVAVKLRQRIGGDGQRSLRHFPHEEWGPTHCLPASPSDELIAASRTAPSLLTWIFGGDERKFSRASVAATGPRIRDKQSPFEVGGSCLDRLDPQSRATAFASGCATFGSSEG
jgi:hypothetical protein